MGETVTRKIPLSPEIILQLHPAYQLLVSYWPCRAYRENVLRAETAAGKRAYHTIRRCQSVAESCQATDRSPTSHFIDQPIGSREGETGDVVWNGVWMLFGSNIRLACAKRLPYVLLRISEMYGVIAYFAVYEIGRTSVGTWASHPSLPSIKVLFKLDLLLAI